MSVTPQRARHRSAGRPLTPLDDLATAATGCLAHVGRRSAVVAASSGLVLTMAIPASATSTDGPVDALPAVNLSALTADARVALAVSPVVSVPVDAAWSFEAPAITVVANPEPEPEPEPEPAPRPARSSSSSRSTERAAAPAASSGTASAQATAAPAPEPAPAPKPEPAPAPVASGSGSSVLAIAQRYVGVPYVYGGGTPAGFDCSGFTSYVYAQLGVSLPRSSGAQRNVGRVVSRAEAQPGDLIWSPGHVAIYAGGNQQYDAPRPGKSVQLRSIWQSNPTFIRVIG